MARNDIKNWTPFRPTAADLKTLEKDVAEIEEIQKTLVTHHKDLVSPDRVAHQYQIAGGKVLLKISDQLPAELLDVGLFGPKARHFGIGRISTGLGTPHIETNPDFLGAMFAFQTPDGHRVDFLGINDATSPTDNHHDFMDVLYATGASAGADFPYAGAWGEYDALNLIAEQKEFAEALKERMGWVKGGKALMHLTNQTLRTFFSSTAYQTYWTGIVEVGSTAGKFTFVPTRDENKRPGFRPGERHLTEEWEKRQRDGDLVFALYWIPFLDEDKTSARKLTAPWQEAHKELVGHITFPKTELDSEEAQLWAILASEMGANPENWVHNKDNSIREPATEFGTARKIAYRKSQEGRGALDPRSYQSVFTTGRISTELAQELRQRREKKRKAGHVSWAP